MSTPARHIIVNPRLMAVLLLGFSSGLPLALTNATLQAWFTEANVSLTAIGATSLIGIPYTLKFLWAPLLDYIRMPCLGLRKGWILISQGALVIALVMLSGMDPSVAVRNMCLLALVVAFLSATQDVAIDAYRTDVLQTEERGMGAAYYVFSYRVALLVSGGLALILADYLGFRATYLIMAACLLFAMVLACFSPQTSEFKPASSDLLKTVYESVLDFIKRDQIVLVLLFLMLYKVGDALALQLMTNFLLHGLGFSLTEIGLAYKIVSFVATVSGAFVGGLFLTRWPIFRALLVFGLAQAFSNIMFVILAICGKQFMLMASAIFIENFCSGLSTAALMAFMMSLCHRRFTASQFALFSAISSLGRVFLGPVAAVLVSHLGWVSFYTWCVALSFPGLIILLFLKGEVVAYASLAAD